MKKYIINMDNIVESKISDDELVILSLESGEYLGLNSSAIIVWDDLKQEKEIEEIIYNLSEIFEISIDEIENDVLSVIDEMMVAGIIIER